MRNAADPRQVRAAERIDKRRDERFLTALAQVVDTPQGRIVFAELIRRAGVYRSIWSPSAEIHYMAGQQDFGHMLMATLVDMSLDHFQLMEREEWAWLKQEQRSIEAAHTQRSGERAERHDDEN